MKARKIIDLSRSWLDDTIAPYLWTDTELLIYLDQAQQEACRRERLLFDDAYSISVTSGTATYTLDSGLVVLDKVRYNDIPLVWRTIEEMDKESQTWKTSTADEPTQFVVRGFTLTVIPVPSANYTLEYEGYRLPDAEINDLEDTPEIPAEFHHDLAHWVCHEAFLKHDAESYDKNKSDYHLASFERMFGRPVPAGVRANQRRGPKSLRPIPPKYTPSRAIYDADSDLDW